MPWRLRVSVAGDCVGVEAVEGVDDGKVELAPSESSYFGDRPGCLVGAVVGEGIEDVGDSDDAPLIGISSPARRFG